MQNFRVIGQPVNVYLPLMLRCIPYSSDLTDEKYKELLQHLTDKDKIRTEKFKRMLLFLRKKNNNDHAMYTPVADRAIPIGKELLPSLHNLSEVDKKLERFAKDITNIFDDVENTESGKTEKVVSTESTDQWDDQQISNSNTNKNNYGLVDNITLENGISVSRRGPDLGNSTDRSNASIYLADLSSAIVPLSLHQKDKSLLIDALVQDVNQLHFKASKIVGSLYLQVQQRGHLWYGTKEELVRQPKQVLGNKIVKAEESALTTKSVTLLDTLKYESSLWLCETKTPTSTEKPPEPTEGLLNKIKKIIQELITALKQKTDKEKKPDIKK